MSNQNIAMNHRKRALRLNFNSWASIKLHIKEMIAKAMLNPILLLGVIAVIIFSVSTLIAYEFFFHNKRELLVQMIAESFGIVLDIGVLGILMIWITKANDKKRKINDALKEIDDLRFWGSDKKGGAEVGKSVYIDQRLEYAEATLKNWQISYAALKIVRNIKTLAKAGFQPIDLNHCQVPSSNLSGIDLFSSNLDMINMSGCNLSKTNMDCMTACSGSFKDADLSFASLRNSKANGADFRNSVLLNVDCSYGNFINTSFAGARIQNALFINANLLAADFEGAILVGVNFSHATGLTAGQLNKAKYFLRCVLPEELERELEALKKPGDSGLTSPRQPQFLEQRKAV